MSDEDSEKAIALGNKIFCVCADSGNEPLIQLHALIITTAFAAQTLGVSLEATRCAMHAFLNPAGAGNAGENVIALEKFRRGSK